MRTLNVIAPLLTLTALLTAASITWGQVELTTNGNFVYSDHFSDFSGTVDPADWASFDAAGVEASVWQGEGTGSSSTGGKWSYGEANSSDRAFGFLPSSTRAIYAEIAFINNTGATITDLTIAYDAEHWRSANGGRNNGWEVSLDTGSGFSLLPALTYIAANSNATGVNPDGGPWETVSLSQTVSALSIGDGESFTIQFFGDNGTGGGFRQGVAFDNFTLSTATIPESSTYAGIFGVLVLSAAVVRRRFIRNV